MWHRNPKKYQNSKRGIPKNKLRNRYTLLETKEIFLDCYIISEQFFQRCREGLKQERRLIMPRIEQACKEKVLRKME